MTNNFSQVRSSLTSCIFSVSSCPFCAPSAGILLPLPHRLTCTVCVLPSYASCLSPDALDFTCSSCMLTWFCCKPTPCVLPLLHKCTVVCRRSSCVQCLGCSSDNPLHWSSQYGSQTSNGCCKMAQAGDKAGRRQGSRNKATHWLHLVSEFDEEPALVPVRDPCSMYE